MVKNLPANAGDIRAAGSIPGSGRSPGEGNGYPPQYSCLGKFHGQRLMGYCPQGRKWLDMTEHKLLIRKDKHTPTWRTKWQPTPVFLSGKSHGQRSLVGYSSWGHKELDMTERLNHHHNHAPLCSWQHYGSYLNVH